MFSVSTAFRNRTQGSHKGLSFREASASVAGCLAAGPGREGAQSQDARGLGLPLSLCILPWASHFTSLGEWA